MSILDSWFLESWKKRRQLSEQLNAIVAEFMSKASKSQPDRFGVDREFDQKVQTWSDGVADNFSKGTWRRGQDEIGEWLALHKFPPGGASEFRTRVNRAKRAMQFETRLRWVGAVGVLGISGVVVAVLSQSRLIRDGCAPPQASPLATPGPPSRTEPPSANLPTPGSTERVVACDLAGVVVATDYINFPPRVAVTIHIVKPSGIYSTYFDGHFTPKPPNSHGFSWDENDPRHGSFNAPGTSVASEAYASFTTEAWTTVRLGFWGLDSGQGGPRPVTPQTQLRVAGRDSFLSVRLIGSVGDLPGSMSIGWDCAR